MTLFLEKLVSKETLLKFKIYERLLREWNRKTALVQEDTLDSFALRHVIDSLQIIPIIQSLTFLHRSTSQDLEGPKQDLLTPFTQTIQDPYIGKLLLDDVCNADKQLSIIDVGTGAGFPGLVLAICGFANVTLCDSNHKKCLFLSEVARHTDTKVMIINDRVENLRDKYELIVSRALTDLNGLCLMMSALSSSGLSCGLFHKGRNWHSEVSLARKSWSFNATAYGSLTSDESVVVLIKYLSYLID
jgi:16S rRNA (guanine527-N7)-methyltransferase